MATSIWRALSSRKHSLVPDANGNPVLGSYELHADAAVMELDSAFGMIGRLLKEIESADDLTTLPANEALVSLQARSISATLVLATLTAAQVRATLAVAAAVRDLKPDG